MPGAITKFATKLQLVLLPAIIAGGWLGGFGVDNTTTPSLNGLCSKPAKTLAKAPAKVLANDLAKGLTLARPRPWPGPVENHKKIMKI